MRDRMPKRAAAIVCAVYLTAFSPQLVLGATDDKGAESTRRGYYRDPAVHGDTVVFTSEGDLWTVSVKGGAAQRLTTAPGTESRALISPDGKTVAFLANYEGPDEVYAMPIAGGLPQRRTWDGNAAPVGWAPDGRLMIATRRYATLPSDELALIDDQGHREILPLAEAAQGTYTQDGHTLIFTRWNQQPSETKRYKGGWTENLWRFDGKNEALPLTEDYDGTSAHPMVDRNRVYFLSDRDGVMNVWSMDLDGKNLKQESHQKLLDVRSASLSDGHIVYASGADLWLLDPGSGSEQVIPITLTSDFDQMREHWVKKPIDYLSWVHLSPDGSSVVFTARGEVFTLPAKTGRVVKVASNSAVRYRDARFLPDGKSIVAISTESGETEFWKYPANGVGKPEQWTKDAKVTRSEGIISPDGNFLAHTNRDEELWIYDIKKGLNKRIAQSMNGGFRDLEWSPDSKWLAYSDGASNTYRQLKVLNLDSGKMEAITSDRFDSATPVWSTDGKWLYFLSDRSLKTTIPSPWGPREPEPHFDRPMKIYQLALVAGLRSPFTAADELHPDKKEDEKKPDQKPAEVKDATQKPDEKKDEKRPEDKKTEEKRDDKKVEVKIDFTDMASRLSEVPVPAGNYQNLQATEKRLCWLNAADDMHEHVSLQCVDIANKGEEPDTVMADVKGYEISADHKKMIIAKKDDFYIFDSDVKGAALGDPKALAKGAVNLSRWTINTVPREEYRGIFLDAWRMERDYFYDKNMHGVNWPAMRDRYMPLVDRVADRDELNDVIAQMVGELSALHTFVEGGDAREPADHVDLATLGARVRREEKAGGLIVEHIYAHDPDLPNDAPPLARPDSLVKEGEVIVSIDGVDTLSVPDEGVLLRGKAGTQVLLHVKDAKGDAAAAGGRDVLVTPVSAHDDGQLRYSEWEYTRRMTVDKESNGTIGYVHLRAMGPNDINQWARDFYPFYNRQGLIIDVRHNHGGNVDSWLLGKLLRQAWFYFQPRVGNPIWNMQYAFRGHIVVLCDHETASDGEAFSEGFKRLKLGKVLGTRTWGGEIWLSMDNRQADNGIASAAETGVYADGKWLIEGHGVDPDVVVDNLPHQTFSGKDTQLEAAMKELAEEIKSDPRPVPPAPPHPDKSFRYQP